MSAFQFDLSFEKNDLEFIRLEKKSLEVSFGNTLLENGIMTFVWFDPTGEGMSFDDEESLFRIYFKNKNSNAIDFSFFEITQKITPPVAYNFSGKPSRIQFDILEDENLGMEKESFLTVYQNQPNPFTLCLE